MPSAIVRPSKGWISVRPFLALDGPYGLEGSVHVRHQDQLRAVTAHLGDAEGVRPFHHHHLGGGADAVCGEGHRDGVIAGAHRSDATHTRRIVEGERAEQRAPRLEGAGALEQLQLEEDFALRPQRVRDRGSAPAVHRGLVDQIAEGLPGRLHRGKIRWSRILVSQRTLLPAGSAARASR